MKVTICDVGPETVYDVDGSFGIRYAADLRFWHDEAGDGFLAQRLTTGGLWEIDPGSGEEYIESVKAQELVELEAMFEALGFAKLPDGDWGRVVASTGPLRCPSCTSDDVVGTQQAAPAELACNACGSWFTRDEALVKVGELGS